MQVLVESDEQAVARAAAEWIAAQARTAVEQRGQFLLAVSGGKTPWIMLRELAREDVPWKGLHIFQIDERVAPAGHADRNLTHLEACLLGSTPLTADQIHPMPVNEEDLEGAAAKYARTLQQWGGTSPVLDVAHLGLGTDGHTASLIPGDPVLKIHDRDVATTGEYQGRRRLTLTFPILNRSRQILWLATGVAKREMIDRMLLQDHSIPAGSISQTHAVLITDQPLNITRSEDAV